MIEKCFNWPGLVAERGDLSEMTVDTAARAEVILEEPEEDEAFGKEEEDGNEEEEADSDGDFKRERMTSFEERMLAANPEVTQKTEDHNNSNNIIRIHT